MAGAQDASGKLTPDEAKLLLIQEAPAPVDTFLRDPLDLIRRHPREAVAIAAAVGVALVASRRFRLGTIGGLATAARFLLK